ncbi:cation:proton antiporter [Companilactobacillus metriopterae]|uniref:cation:proton antiporter n=1 Tax=Companilactobacillus metriopterae TaxID=1909267 RepID=UPI00100B6649|nr:cation:proton antiporter [Companilactobacillus metriopterae]
MTVFYTVAFLLVGVIGANIIRRFVTQIPEVFILIATGAFLSIFPIFHNFEIEPEYFMLLFIAPLMFYDGQKQSFEKVRSKFWGIFIMSVVLACVTVLIVGFTANTFEVKWTLPLAIALAAIVTPTDAMAVKTMTSNRSVPTGVNDALELESLFNDATGLVLLDLALSVLYKGNFSVVGGIGHFLFVSIGGIIVGLIGGIILVMVRYNINIHGDNPELITIPISLLTPFFIYLLAEYFGVSGILAVVATGIEHNWESDRLKLTSTNVQLTTKTIWSVITDILNDMVFLILGLALPSIWKNFEKIGFREILSMLLVSLIIYLVMITIRYFGTYRNDGIKKTFWRNVSREEDRKYSQIFAIGGIHGTVTLAMAFSLPKTIGGQPFPYREELITITTFVIIISMIFSAIIFPIILKSKSEDYDIEDLNDTRNKMVDYAILQMRSTIEDHDIREKLTYQLETQKRNRTTLNRKDFNDNFYLLFNETKSLTDSFIHSDEINKKYSPQTIDIYDHIMYRSLIENKRIPLRDRIQHMSKEIIWHTKHRVITRRQREVFRNRRIENDQEYAQKVSEWTKTREELLSLNNEVIEEVDNYLDSVMQARLEQNKTENTHIFMVRKVMDRFFNNVKHEYQANKQPIDNSYYMEAFQHEYSFIQECFNNGEINQEISSTLFTEINQAQLLQLQTTY